MRSGRDEKRENHRGVKGKEGKIEKKRKEERKKEREKRERKREREEKKEKEREREREREKKERKVRGRDRERVRERKDRKKERKRERERGGGEEKSERAIATVNNYHMKQRVASATTWRLLGHRISYGYKLIPSLS